MIDRARVHRIVDAFVDDLLDALEAPTSSLKGRLESARDKPAKLTTKRPRAPYQPENQPSELDAARARQTLRRLGRLPS